MRITTFPDLIAQLEQTERELERVQDHMQKDTQKNNYGEAPIRNARVFTRSAATDIRGAMVALSAAEDILVNFEVGANRS